MNKKPEKSKLSIVTGGRGGIGSEIIRMLKDRGDTVYSIGRSDASSDHIQADLASENGLEKILPTLGRRKVDNLVFSHRYRGSDPREDCDISFLALDRAICSLEKSFSRNASIVILSSVAAMSVLDEQSAIYHGTRSGIEGLTRFFAVRLGAKGIRCNCVLPSTLIKSSNKRFFTKTNPVRRLIEEITPISRMGSAVDIANLVEFLCSNRASYITGQSIVVDGGLSLVNQESIARRLANLQH
jgi:NAD(P)-dependent dehydrogenase (short-subunit alcohol dehydrogenase family)